MKIIDKSLVTVFTIVVIFGVSFYLLNKRDNNIEKMYPRNNFQKELSEKEVEIVVIDSCEYVYAWFSRGIQHSCSLTHKGNCKFCKERCKLKQ